MALRKRPVLAIADAYGLPFWRHIAQLDFTFNVKLGNNRFTRKWTWRPKVDEVTLHRSNGQSITYYRGKLAAGSPEEVLQADKWFVNDHYWFLFPFQLVWSKPTATGPATFPLGEGRANKVVASYLPTGGYTPGDVYELFVDDQNRIVQWVFRRGEREQARPATWKRHAKLGSIIVSLGHCGTDEAFQLWFTDVHSLVVGGEEPLKTVPIED